ncbi:hypothetical protein FB446DRAFT_750444, partial [Lentinula raphanica]
GLFLGSGRALANAGPVGAILGYLFTGILISGVVLSIDELAALVPLTGSYITASAVLISFWTTSVSNGVWITVMGLLIIGTSLFFIRVYGELEFSFFDTENHARRGHDHHGSLGQFLGFWTTFSNAAYSYSGVETIAATAAETKNPGATSPRPPNVSLSKIAYVSFSKSLTQ